MPSQSAVFAQQPYGAANLSRDVLPVQPSVGLPPDKLEAMVKIAASTTTKGWDPAAHISLAKNAHRTNKPKEMESSLYGDFNYFEGDIRVDRSGVVVMAHDRGDRSGLTLDQWLQIGAASQRGMKFDVKESGAIDYVLQAAQKSAIPQQRLLFNFGVHNADVGVNANQDQLLRARQMFPQSIINLSFPAPYSANMIERVGILAKNVGGPIMFPLQAQFVTPAIVASLKRFGMIAIWNDPGSYRPSDIPAATAKFRAMGVDGMIDLRR